MSKTRLNVPKDELQAAINEAEKETTFTSRADLFKVVAQSSWARFFQPKPLTVSMIQVRVNELGVELQTPPGKRGWQGGPRVQRGPRKTRKQKFAEDPAIVNAFERLAEKVPERFQPVVDKMRNGSRTAAVKLKCLDCCAYQVAEVKFCTCVACPLWAFRPYKSTAIDAEEDGIEAGEIEEQQDIDEEIEEVEEEMEV
tara:strand:+ start:3735 stop:4328 length:594 start_codon:yes stop_codon:yes gene_type:complete